MDVWMIIIFILMFALVLFFMSGFFYWKDRHSDAIEMWTKESETKDKILVELNERIKELEGRDKIVRIEKFVARPTTITGKFDIMTEFIEDQSTFKNIVIREMAREIAEQLYLNPYSYQVFFLNSRLEQHETVEIRMRFLPYPEAAVWEEVKLNENN